MTAQSLFTVVDEATVEHEIASSRSEVIQVVRSAYLAHHRGRSSLPPSVLLTFPEGGSDRIIALPAYLGDGVDTAGVKWIASFPGNVSVGLPRASAVVILNDPRTGRPFACLAGASISSARTAASAVLAAEALHGERRARCLGVLGTGVIAEQVVVYLLAAGWTLDGVRCVDRDLARAERFAQRTRALGFADVRAGQSPPMAFDGCDLVVIATTAAAPHLFDPALLDGRPTVLHLSLRDLSVELIGASQNVTDDLEHAARAGTSLALASKGDAARVVDGTLGDLLLGSLVRDIGRAAVFSPFGLGVLDVALARWAFDRVQSVGGGTVVDDFLGPPAEVS